MMLGAAAILFLALWMLSIAGSIYLLSAVALLLMRKSQQTEKKKKQQPVD
jgi:4-hydroxybenzoate polyprenyltransferase